MVTAKHVAFDDYLGVVIKLEIPFVISQSPAEPQTTIAHHETKNHPSPTRETHIQRPSYVCRAFKAHQQRLTLVDKFSEYNEKDEV